MSSLDEIAQRLFGKPWDQITAEEASQDVVDENEPGELDFIARTGHCEDYPCCGHTPDDPCNYKPHDWANDPHLMCEHGNGYCEVAEREADDDDDEWWVTPDE